MRIGGLPLVCLHVGFAFAALIAAPYLVNDDPAQMMIIPLDLEIADTTNLAPTARIRARRTPTRPSPKVESLRRRPPRRRPDDEILPTRPSRPKKDRTQED